MEAPMPGAGAKTPRNASSAYCLVASRGAQKASRTVVAILQPRASPQACSLPLGSATDARRQDRGWHTCTSNRATANRPIQALEAFWWPLASNRHAATVTAALGEPFFDGKTSRKLRHQARDRCRWRWTTAASRGEAIRAQQRPTCSPRDGRTRDDPVEPIPELLGHRRPAHLRVEGLVGDARGLVADAGRKLRVYGKPIITAQPSTQGVGARPACQ